MHTTLLVPRDVPGLTLVVNWLQHAPLLTVAAQLALRGPVQVVVGGNRFDTQQLARIVRMQTTAVDETLARIQLARPYFVAQLLAGEMPRKLRRRSKRLGQIYSPAGGN